MRRPELSNSRPVSPVGAQHPTISYHVVENMNRRTAESAGGGQNIEVKNIVLFFSKISAVRNSLFDIRYSKYKRG
jgi:hypothetical protein